ncbi:MAG TPA: MBL fold metallo-hydrolase [Candidatus Polarisedimenticolia bacterium]|nr:MBL fold metallo-hydrolase [Candidatus Polarisedimenticolia bacterium]
MKVLKYLLAAIVLVVLVAALRTAFTSDEGVTNSDAHRPELSYLKAINGAAPPRDPQLLFLLMAAYSNAELQAEGADFFSARLKEFDPRLTDPQKSLYLSIIGLLRAQHASRVSLLHRYGYVKETIAVLEQAKRLSAGNIFVVNWIAGIVHSELPGMFRQRAAAKSELTWCVANAEKAPHAGWLREVYYHLGKLSLADGDAVKAQEYLHRSGYTDFEKPITLVTPYSEDAASGHTFAPRRIAEIVPGRVYVLTGFEFTEYYFVVSEDRHQLIGIDAGTRPDSAKAAYEALRAHAPSLPRLTTVFFTHAHWDHIGGHSFFESLTPRPRSYARSNYQDEVTREVDAPQNFGKQFFGERFSWDDVKSFKPDITVDRQMDLNVGGTRVELVPVDGGETHDAMFVHMPSLGTMFVGDFIMPYIGAPFVEEGDFEGLLSAVDAIVERHPQHLLHGHEPLTQNFASFAMLGELKTDLVWLREQVLSAVRHGDERASIHQANLIPPGLLAGDADAFQPYLILREHVIDRLYDQNVGYWQPDLQGLDHLSRNDHAELLVDYLGMSERQLLKAIERLNADGKYELAAWLLESSGSRFAHSTPVAKARRLIYLKLIEKHQNLDPFKFIIYSGQIGEHVPQMDSGK